MCTAWHNVLHGSFVATIPASDDQTGEIGSIQFLPLSSRSPHTRTDLVRHAMVDDRIVGVPDPVFRDDPSRSTPQLNDWRGTVPVRFDSERPPSMADVAAVAGVSHQTVSRVLNGTGSVSEQTRVRVLESIERLGYRRNEAARSLVTRRSSLLGIIATNSTQYGPANMLHAVQLAANDLGLLPIVATLRQFSAETLRVTIDRFIGQGVEGILAITPAVPVARELDAIPVPVPTIVITSAWWTEETDIVTVGFDQRAAILDAMTHLHSKGCRSVAHFAGPDDNFDAIERVAGWEDAIAALGMERGLMLRGDWTAASGHDMAGQLLEGQLPDALFAANDQMALGALSAFAAADVHIPDDLLVVGFDDEDGAEYFRPGLTTIMQDFASLGERAVDVLVKKVRGESVTPTLIPTELRVRESA